MLYRSLLHGALLNNLPKIPRYANLYSPKCSIAFPSNNASHVSSHQITPPKVHCCQVLIPARRQVTISLVVPCLSSRQIVPCIVEHANAVEAHDVGMRRIAEDGRGRGSNAWRKQLQMQNFLADFSTTNPCKELDPVIRFWSTHACPWMTSWHLGSPVRRFRACACRS